MKRAGRDDAEISSSGSGVVLGVGSWAVTEICCSALSLTSGLWFATPFSAIVRF